MKLLRYGNAGEEKPGLLDSQGVIRDLSSVVNDISGSTLTPDSLARLKAIQAESLPMVEGSPRIGSCIAKPGKFVAQLF